MENLYKNKNKTDEGKRGENDNHGNALSDTDRHYDSALMTASDGSRTASPVTGAPRGKFFRARGGTSDSDESGSETVTSLRSEVDEERERRRFRKRRGSEESGTGSDKGAAKPTKRGRGRPPTTGQYVGLHQAQKEKLAEERRVQRLAEQAEADRQIAEMTRELPELRSHRLLVTSHPDVTMETDEDEVSANAIGKSLAKSLEVITNVASKSKNLSGPFVKALKLATKEIQESTAALLCRTKSTETRALEAANARLSKELAKLRAELAAVRREVRRTFFLVSHSAPPIDIKEVMERASREAVALSSARLDARLESLETRLLPAPRLRPPLASDKKTAAQGIHSAVPRQKTPAPEAVTTLSPPSNPGPAEKRKRKALATVAAKEAAATRRDGPTSLATPKGPVVSEWTKVGNKKGNKGRSGNCAPEEVKVGEIRRNRGRGTAWVKCPVEAAKRATTKGARTYVGWTVVRVALLEARQMRCFKCQEVGHTRATCPSEIDRSESCFRCGQPGHTSAQCENAPHCVLCAEKSKPANHSVGSKACGRPTPRQKTPKAPTKKASQKPAAIPPTAASTAGEGNLNHYARSQDLLDHYAAQWSIDMTVVYEPYRVLPRSNWIGDADSTVALIYGPNIAPPSPGGTIKGRGYVGGQLGTLTVIGIYFSPNRPLAQFEAFLLQLTSVVNGATGPVIVAGDFNAKSALWGCPATDARGRAMERWMASTDLVSSNRGSVSTCVCQQGESIVDIILVRSSAAHRIVNWRVQEDTETLSDLRLIRFDVTSYTSEPAPTTSPSGGPRLSVRRLDRDFLEEAAVVASWVPLPSANAASGAEWLNEASRNICDASMP
nr:uncharacterized protein LOC116775545 [Danaus plexippus plexippus]